MEKSSISLVRQADDIVDKHIPLPRWIAIEILEMIVALTVALSIPDLELHSIAIKSINFLELEENPPKASKPKGMNFRFPLDVSIKLSLSAFLAFNFAWTALSAVLSFFSLDF